MSNAPVRDSEIDKLSNESRGDENVSRPREYDEIGLWYGAGKFTVQCGAILKNGWPRWEGMSKELCTELLTAILVGKGIGPSIVGISWVKKKNKDKH